MEIASVQNLALYTWLMCEMRTAMRESQFEMGRAEWLSRLSRIP